MTNMVLNRGRSCTTSHYIVAKYEKMKPNTIEIAVDTIMETTKSFILRLQTAI
jgi:hypothetical protein